MMASGIPLVSLAVLLAMVGVSLKKLVEQQAFEFLLILSTCSRFDAESALELRYLIIIGY